MNILFLFLSMLYGGLVTRWHGSGLGPRWVSQVMWSLTFSLIPLWYSFAPYYIFIAIWSFVFSFIGIATGHGNGQPLGHVPALHPPNWIEKLILWLKPHMAVYWYEALFLSLCGLATASGGALAFAALGSPLKAAAVALGGLLLPVGYMAGWKICPKETCGWFVATELGEALAGVWIYGMMALALLF